MSDQTDDAMKEAIAAAERRGHLDGLREALEVSITLAFGMHIRKALADRVAEFEAGVSTAKGER